MDPYLILVYLHILGTVVFFASIAVEGVVLQQARRARTVDIARAWVSVLRLPGARMGYAGMLIILVTGIWMMFLRWGVVAWMVAALVAVAGIIAVGSRSRAVLSQVIEELGEDHVRAESEWRGLLGSPGLVLSLWLRVGIAIGILALMTIKPVLSGSVAVIAGGVVLGVALSRFAQRTPTSESRSLSVREEHRWNT